MHEKEVLQKLIFLREKYTLFELGRRLDIHPNTIWRWLKTGKINRNMVDLLERRLNEAKLQ